MFCRLMNLSYVPKVISSVMCCLSFATIAAQGIVPISAITQLSGFNIVHNLKLIIFTIIRQNQVSLFFYT